MKKISVLGGDARNLYTAEKLMREGYSVCLCNAEKAKGYEDLKRVPFSAENTDILILSVPLTKDGKTLFAPFSEREINLSDLEEEIKDIPLKIGGKSDVLTNVIDITSREDFKILNAVPSVEGALQIAMENTPHTLFGSTCFVIGYGRLGKRLCDTLSALGAKVCVCARSFKDIAEIKTKGFPCVQTSALKSFIKDADIVFNTVPAPLLGEKELLLSKETALFIDLASGRGGIVNDTEKAFPRKVIKALALPGKVAPISAGDILFETVKNIISEHR